MEAGYEEVLADSCTRSSSAGRDSCGAQGATALCQYKGLLSATGFVVNGTWASEPTYTLGDGTKRQAGEGRAFESVTCSTSTNL